MNVWEIYQFINWRSNKEQSGRTYTPDQFNIGLQAVDIELLKIKYGLPEEYKPNQPFPRQGWEITQKISDDLSHLKVVMNGYDRPLLVVVSGFADVPADYLHYSSLRYDSTISAPIIDGVAQGSDVNHSVPIEVLKNADFDARLWSIIKNLKPYKYPYAQINQKVTGGKYIEIRPTGIRYVVFSYIRTPISGVLAVTLDGNNDYVYDAANSRDVEWALDLHIDLSNILYQWLGQNLSNQQMNQDAQQRKMLGQ